MSQIYKSAGGGTGGPIDTLSAENGAATPPNGNNFNFSGTATGGYGSNGGIVFTTVNPGEMNAQVQVDNTTVVINASNQLVAVGSMVWTIISTSQVAVLGIGYFINVGSGNVVLTLPAVATIGQTFAAYALTGSTWTIQCGAGQQLQVNDIITTSGGSVTSTKVGDFIFVKAVTSTAWVAIPFSGNFETT